MKRFILIGFLFLSGPVFGQSDLSCKQVELYLQIVGSIHVQYNFQWVEHLALKVALSRVQPLAMESQQKGEFIKTIIEAPSVEHLCENLNVLFSNEDHFNENFLKEIISSLDPHSLFFRADKATGVASYLANKGLGIGVYLRGLQEWGFRGPYEISKVIPNTTAFAIGLQEGDHLVSIDGQSLDSLPIDDVNTLMEGLNPDSQIVIDRLGQRLTYRGLRRTTVSLPTVDSHFIGEGIAYIKIYDFAPSTAREFIAHIHRLKSAYGQEVRGILLDLRNNLGGLRDAVVECLDALVDMGIVLISEGPSEGRQFDVAQYPGRETDAPIVVLVNSMTASAAEILAGTLKEHGRAIIVGDRTHGKGSVQSVLPLSNSDLLDSYLKRLSRSHPRLENYDGYIFCTTEWFYLPSGFSPQYVGITPDIEIKDPSFDHKMAAYKKYYSHFIEHEADYPNAIKIDPRKFSFSPTSPFRESALKEIKPASYLRENYSDLEKENLQFYQALDVLKTVIHRPLSPTEISAVRLYARPIPQLRLKIDFPEDREVHLHFKFKSIIYESHWLGLSSERIEKLIYTTEATLDPTQKEIVLTLESDSLDKAFKTSQEGFFILEIEKDGSPFYRTILFY